MLGFKGIVYKVAVGAALICLCGCSFAMKSTYIYQNGEKYIAGDREISDKIENIDIDYMSGKVDLVGTDSNTVTIKETSEKELDDKRKVHTWVDGNTLYVRYCESAKGLDLNNLKKHLEITIPKEIKLTDADIKVSSADVRCSDFEVENADFTASSGDINANVVTDTIKLNVSSGDIMLDQTGKSSEIKAHASSGKININMEDADKLDLSASSGSITVNANRVNEFKSVTSSGDNVFRFKETPSTTDISASSGEVTIYLPKDADLDANLKPSSGKLFYDLEFKKDGDSYVSGKGSNQMKVHTSSGDINIKKLNSEE